MKKIIIIFSTLALSACGVSSHDGVMARSDNKGGFMGLSTLENVEFSGEKALVGVQAVTIGSFKVGFTESAKESRKAGGGLLGSGMGGKAQGNVKLEGVSDSVKQAITNAAYADFVSTLKANGYSINNENSFLQSENFAKAKKYNFPYVMDNSGFLSSYGQSTFFQPSAIGNQGIMLMGEIQGVTGGIGFSSGDNVAVKYALDTGTPVVSATYIVDFATAGGHGNNWTSSASVQIGQNLAVTSGTFKVVKDHTSSFKSGTATASLGQPIESGKEFGEIIDNTSTTNKAVQETLNVATALLSGGTNRSRDYVIKADPSKYKSQSVDVLKQANSSLIQAAAKSR